MSIILDTSAAIEVALHRDKSSAITRLLSEAETVLAPDIFIAEATNVYWKYFKFEDLPLTICEQALKDTLDLVDQLIPASTIAFEVFAASCLTGHPAYDLFFVILARRLNASIVTLDSKLIKCAEKLAVKVEGL